MFHQPRQISDFSLSASCVLLSVCHLIVLLIPRLIISVFRMSPSDCLSPISASSVANCALHISAARVLNAMIAGSVSLQLHALQRDLTVTKQVNEFRQFFNCPRFFDSLVQRDTQYILLIPLILFERSQRTAIP